MAGDIGGVDMGGNPHGMDDMLDNFWVNYAD